MSSPARTLLVVMLGLLALAQTGCHQHMLRQSQLRSRQLYEQNRALATEREKAAQAAQALAAEKARLEQERSAMQQTLSIANQRVDNLNQERARLQQNYTSLLQRAKSPLPNETTRRLEDLARRYPDFEFDPQTGVSKFHSDILFESGSADLRPDGQNLLREFASILNQGDAQRLNILVVGHTDDKPIAKDTTRRQHPTNWHLSTNRANSVVLFLSKSGVKENRLGASGYSMFQPAVPNTDEKARQKNRRVEIYVLTPDAVVAGWDPKSEARQ